MVEGLPLSVISCKTNLTYLLKLLIHEPNHHSREALSSKVVDRSSLPGPLSCLNLFHLSQSLTAINR